MLDTRNIVMENNSFDGLVNRMNKTEYQWVWKTIRETAKTKK